ncbi:MAG: glycosyltransferase family 39 protein [Candidatus Aureabacteria bacterium]|nr:glycosyltransferase family 39 protein [Candidatus Auribacterota bacterium]
MKQPRIRFINIMELLSVTMIPMALTFYLMQPIGIGWDEPSYILSGIRYLEWFRNLSLESFSPVHINQYWNINHEHPPLAKLGFGLFHVLFNNQLGLLDSARFFNCFLYGLFNLGLFIFLDSLYSKNTARLTILILQCFPRFLTYTHTAMLDFPVAFLWLAMTCTYFMTTKNAKYFIHSCLFYGALHLTKFTGAMAVFPAFIWGLFYEPLKTLKKIFLLLLFGFMLFMALWPWFYHDTTQKLNNYFLNKYARVSLFQKKFHPENAYEKLPSGIPVYYLGRIYQKDHSSIPWHYTPVLFLTSLPSGILFFFTIGLLSGIHNRKKDPFMFLCVVNVICLAVVMMLPVFPKYAGIRFLLPLYPFAAILSTTGMKTCYSWSASPAKRFALFLLAVFFACNFLPVVKYRDSLSNYYNAAAGGIKGAVKTGLPINDADLSFSPEIIQYINDHLRENGKITLTPTSPYVRQLYQDLALFRPDIRIVETPDEADWIILFYAREFFDETLRDLFRESTPVYKKEVQGVTLCQIYERTVVRTNKDIPSGKEK